MPDYDLTQADYILREILSDEIIKMFQEAAIGWNLVPDGSGDFTNVANDVSMTYARGYSWPVHLEPNPQGGYYGPSGTLLQGGTSVGQRMASKYTRFHIAAGLGGDILSATKQDVVAGSQKFARRIQQDTDTAIKMLNEDFWEDGSGVKALVASKSAGTPGTITTAAPFLARRIRKNGTFDVYASDLTTLRTNMAGVTVTGVNQTTGVLNVSVVDASVAATDYIVQANSISKAVKGMRHHVNNDTGTYQGLSRSTYAAQLQSYVDDEGGTGTLKVALLDKLEARILYKRGAEYTFDEHVWAMSPAQRQAYRALGYNSDSTGSFVVKRFEGPGGTLDLGYETLTHNGRKMIIDTDCRDDEVYLNKFGTFRKHIVRPLGPLNEDGLTIRMVPAFTSGGVGSFAHKYVYYLVFMGQISCRDPQVNAVIRNLSTTGLPNGSF